MFVIVETNDNKQEPRADAAPCSPRKCSAVQCSAVEASIPMSHQWLIVS